MGRELQKKKKRSSIPKIKLKPKSKHVNPLGNPIIAANWNQSETLTQNYRRLGLTSRLNSATGGIEKLRPASESKSSTTHKLAISNSIPTVFAPTEARVERDAEGKIVRVIHAKRRANPLNDPLNSDSEDEDNMGDEGNFNGLDGEEKGEENVIIKELEEQANRGEAKRERKQSEREKEWIERLVSTHGDDYGKMWRDRKLNPMQQTEGDLRRRVEKWRAGGGVVVGDSS